MALYQVHLKFPLEVIEISNEEMYNIKNLTLKKTNTDTYDLTIEIEKGTITHKFSAPINLKKSSITFQTDENAKIIQCSNNNYICLTRLEAINS
jgi:hypothetical protein